MSGTDQDANQLGLSEGAAVRGVCTSTDGPLLPQLQKVRGVLKKVDCKADGSDWTNEEINSGAAEAAGALAEVIITEDGQIIEHWIRGESEHGPPEG